MLTLDDRIATLVAFNPRTELHGDEHVPAADLVFEFEASNVILREFHPALLAALYQKDDAPSDMFPDATALTVYRFPAIEAFAWKTQKATPSRVLIAFGVSGAQDIDIADAEVDKFRIEPRDGGTVVIRFRVKGKPTESEMGRLCTCIGSKLSVYVAPTQDEVVQEEPKDEKQSPKQAAEAMFLE